MFTTLCPFKVHLFRNSGKSISKTLSSNFLLTRVEEEETTRLSTLRVGVGKDGVVKTVWHSVLDHSGGEFGDCEVGQFIWWCSLRNDVDVSAMHHFGVWTKYEPDGSVMAGTNLLFEIGTELLVKPYFKSIIEHSEIERC